MTATRKQTDIKRKVFYGILFLLAIVVVIYPLKLPIFISIQTKSYVNVINQLKPGDVVVFGNTNIGPPIASRTQYQAMFDFLLSKQIKLIIVNLAAGGESASEYMLSYGGTLTKYNYKYGENYVIMPYLPGDELAMSGVAKNFRTVYSTDYKGTPIDNIPVLNGINNFNDVTLAIAEYSIFTYGDMFVRQWAVGYKPIIVWGQFYGIAAYYGQYVIGNVDGTLRAAAEFELLVNMPGEELSRNDAQNLQGLAVILAVWIPAALSLLGQENLAKKLGSGERF